MRDNNRPVFRRSCARVPRSNLSQLIRRTQEDRSGAVSLEAKWIADSLDADLDMLQCLWNDNGYSVKLRDYNRDVIPFDANHIMISHRSGQNYFVSAKGDLFPLLADPGKVDFVAAGSGNPYPRIILKETEKRFYLSRFLYFCYQAIEAGESAGAFALYAEETMKCARDEQGKALDVDHVNSDKFNNTAWNLALLTREQNRLEKSDLTGRFRFPYCFVPFVTPSSEYRAAFGYILERVNYRLVNFGLRAPCARAFSPTFTE